MKSDRRRDPLVMNADEIITELDKEGSAPVSCPALDRMSAKERWITPLVVLLVAFTLLLLAP